MIPFGTKSVTLSMLIDLLTSKCRSTQVKIASTDLWPQEMFTFSEMLALVESESSFGAYVCHRRPGGSRATSDLVSCKENIKFGEDGTHSLPTLLLAEKCTWSSWCGNRKVLSGTNAEMKRTRVFLSTRQLVNKPPCASPRSAPPAALRWHSQLCPFLRWSRIPAV